MTLTDRLAALSGLGGAALFVVANLLSDPASELNPNPTADADLVARAFADNAESAQAGAWSALASAFLLMVFLARLHSTLRSAAPVGSWFPALGLLGGAMLVAVTTVGAMVAFAASEVEGYATDTVVAKVLLQLMWNAAALYAPCFAALIAAVALVVFTSGGLPRWLGWASMVALLLVGVVTLLGAAGAATMPGVLWLVVVSVVLTAVPGPSRERVTALQQL